MTAILPLQAGTMVGGHYIVETLINTGGFGAVYRGVDTSEGQRPCAIKETYDVTPTARRQALMEAAVLFTVKSPHLPQVYDAFEDRGRFYLVMQLIEGQNLLQMLRGRAAPFSEQEVLAWLLPIMDVLQELHSRNPPVLHRDIKPANIILTPGATAVLVDFGLTRLYDPAAETQTLVRAVSEGFSPLEQYIGKTCPQSDVYALAATMYFLLTLQAPPASISRSMHDGLIPPRALNPQLSPKIEQVLLKALALHTHARYATMGEFARALRDPNFMGYAEPTIANSKVYVAVKGTGVASSSSGPARSPAPVSPAPALPASSAPLVLRAPAPGTSRKGNARSQPATAPAYRAPAPVPAKRAPVVRTAYPMPVIPPPPGLSLSAAQPIMVPVYRSLPSPFSQGCLWGLIQGVVAALLLLILKKESSFYVAILTGFVFYLVAGFCTTRKGGKVSRAAWAGFWAGITSTIIFWIVLPLGLAILLAQRIQADTALGPRRGKSVPFTVELSRALHAVGPSFPAQAHIANQPAWVGVVIFLAGGLLCAMVLGLLGGFLGHKKDIQT